MALWGTSKSGLNPTCAENEVLKAPARNAQGSTSRLKVTKGLNLTRVNTSPQGGYTCKMPKVPSLSL